MTLHQAVSRSSDTMSGALCFRGTRVPVQTLFDHLEVGLLEQFYADFPGVTPQMVEAVLQASAELIDLQIPPSNAA
ncbi:MAG: DUF433 domain-containing protein [Fimbriimonadaceae bacterium]